MREFSKHLITASFICIRISYIRFCAYGRCVKLRFATYFDFIVSLRNKRITIGVTSLNVTLPYYKIKDILYKTALQKTTLLL